MSPKDKIGGGLLSCFFLKWVFPLLPMPCKFAFKGPPIIYLGTNILYVPKRQNRGELLSCFFLKWVFPLLPMPKFSQCKFAFKGPPIIYLGTNILYVPKRQNQNRGNYSHVFFLKWVFPLLPMPCKFAFKGPPIIYLGTNILYVPKRQNRGELLSCFFNFSLNEYSPYSQCHVNLHSKVPQ